MVRVAGDKSYHFLDHRRVSKDASVTEARGGQEAGTGPALRKGFAVSVRAQPDPLRQGAGGRRGQGSQRSKAESKQSHGDGGHIVVVGNGPE